MPKEILRRLMEMVENDEPVAVVTVLEAKGSAPGKPGFKMLVDLKGSTVGTVGGGLIEATLIKDAVEAIKGNTPKIGTYKLDQESAGGLGMLCGGEITAFIDVIAPQESLLIIGAGHIAVPLAAMGKILGFKVKVLDDREEFCNQERFKTADQCLVGEIEELLASLSITAIPILSLLLAVMLMTRLPLKKRLTREQHILE